MVPISETATGEQTQTAHARAQTTASEQELQAVPKEKEIVVCATTAETEKTHTTDEEYASSTRCVSYFLKDCLFIWSAFAD